MKKIILIFSILISSVSYSQTHEFTMNDFIMSYAHTMDHDSLYLDGYGEDQELRLLGINRYVVDLSEKKVSFYFNDVLMHSTDILSFNETDDRIEYSYMDHGSLSDKDYITYAVYNKIQRDAESEFVIYYLSKLDNTTTVCYRSNH